MFQIPEDLNQYNCIFVSVCGSHAQNAADARSDIDYHACFIEPLSQRLSIKAKPVDSLVNTSTTVDYSGHEIEKYLKMLLKSNCNALEDINSPIMLHKHAEYFDELKEIADMCVTKSMYHCYEGITIGVKKRILYEQYDDRMFQKHHRNMFRNLFTGIHALDTGVIEMNYEVLKEMFDFEEPTYEKWERDFERFMFDLKWAHDHSTLPDETGIKVRNAADKFLLKVRRENW